MKIFIDALGCPKALIDAEKIAAILVSEGHETVSSADDADAVVVNTCGFIQSAKEESIDAILEYAVLKRDRPGLKLIVSGCLTERYDSEISKSIPEIDSIIGVRDPRKIVNALEARSTANIDKGEYLDLRSDRGRHYQFSGFFSTYQKIAEGCRRSCAFCAIPGIRGTQRSIAPDAVVEETKQLIEDGFREIILVSEDTVSYGLDLSGKKELVGLLERLLKLDLTWLRVMYLFPEDIVKEIAGLMKSEPKLCPYIDIPLQHVSPKILKAMNRSGSPDVYAKLIDDVRSIAPDIAVRTSFIVGFPGENEDDHNMLKDFITAMMFDRVGFFDYSDEEGTAAHSMKPWVGPKDVLRRRRTLEDLQTEISAKRLERLVGRELTCINDGSVVDEEGVEKLVMRTVYDAPEIDGAVYVAPGNYELEAVEFAKVRIDSVDGDHDLSGTMTGVVREGE